MKKQPLVSVGMPIYNRPESFKKALSSIINQTYENIEIIISDNCSENKEIIKIIDKFKMNDKRIIFYRQTENIGASANFAFVEEKASGEYFMWASDDDLWDSAFIEQGMRTLLNNPKYKSWFCTIENIDTYDRVTRKYSGFERFTSGKYKFFDIVKYLYEPETLGKANVVYSIYEKKALKNVLSEYTLNEQWGSDNCFNLAFLLRYNMIFTNKVLLKKRIDGGAENKSVDYIVVKYPMLSIFPFNESLRYIKENFNASKSTHYKYLVVFIMFSRSVLAAIYAVCFKTLKIMRGIRQKFKGIANYYNS